MAEISLIIQELYERAYGIGRGKPYYGNQLNEDERQKIEYEQADETPAEGTEFLSVRNTLDAKLPDGRPIFMPIRIGGILLPNEPTMVFTKRKRVAETSMVGSKRKGSVKELITSEDWQITIRGICVNTESTLYYPEDQVAAIRDLDAREEALDVECALFALLGIYRIVILDVTFPEMIGIQHAQAYELKCVSDYDFVLEIE